MQTIILKLSGKALAGIYANPAWVLRLRELQQSHGLVLVHGAGELISNWSEKLSCPAEFVNGQRVTTPEVMQVVAAVQAGLVNKTLTAHLQANGCPAIGLCGIDRGLFTAVATVPNLGRVGYPRYNGGGGWVRQLLREQTMPVFSSVCADANGALMNVNADVFAERLAEALAADAVLFVSDVPGVMLQGRVKKQLTPRHIAAGIKQGDISGGMVPKLQSCLALLEKGVKKIWIGTEEAFYAAAAGVDELNGTWIMGERA